MSLVMKNSPVHSQVGKCLHSTKLMSLCSTSNLNDFQDVVSFLKTHLDDVIDEVHGFSKLLVDDGTVSLNCPPSPEDGDSHGGLLIRTISEQSPDNGEHVILSREFKVHDLGSTNYDSTCHRIEIRCDTNRVMPDDSHKLEEEKVVVDIKRRTKSKLF